MELASSSSSWDAWWTGWQLGFWEQSARYIIARVVRSAFPLVFVDMIDTAHDRLSLRHV
jgi:hypothetical protein